MSVEAPIHSADAAQVFVGPVESLPADFFDNTVAVARGVVGTPETGYGTLVDIMSEGYTIESNPEPVATIFTPGPEPEAISTEEVLEAMLGPADPDDESPAPRFEPYDRHMEVGGQDNQLAKGITLVSEQGIVSVVPAEVEPSARTTDKDMGLGKNLLMGLRRSRAGRAVAVTALAAAEMLSFGTAHARADSQLEQECAQVALAEPQILKSEVLHAGNFNPKHPPTQYFYLSTKYQPMPSDCDGNYARGNEAKAQAFRKGHWVNMGYFGHVSINPDSNQGNWEELGLEKNLHFPVCKARILLKANMVDLNSDNGSPWHPHNVVGTHQYTVPVTKILPHKPKGC